MSRKVLRYLSRNGKAPKATILRDCGKNAAKSIDFLSNAGLIESDKVPTIDAASHQIRYIERGIYHITSAGFAYLENRPIKLAYNLITIGIAFAALIVSIIALMK